MKTLFSTGALGAAAALVLSTSLAFGTEPVAKKPAASPDARKSVAQAGRTRAAPATFSYQPPLRGAPATRVGGGTRSVGAKSLILHVLAPIQTGYTTRERPTIYWYLSDTVHEPLELTITSMASLQEAATPALELTIKPPLEKGVHALRLDEHGVSLKPEVEYQWFVAVVGNPAQRSSDIVAGGAIKRIADGGAVQARLKQAPESAWPAVYAESGIWYDAIDQLSRRIGADPANLGLREQRAALLEQVGLSEAAEFDRAAGR